MTKPRFLVLSVVLVAVAGLYMLLQPRPLAVGLQPGSVNYPMMYAVESGALASTGREVRVQVFRSANDALDALLSEAIFLDAVIPIQNIAAIQISNPGVIGIAALLLSDETHPLDHLVTLAESDIDSPADLRDKTLVVFPGSYSETVTSLALDRLGVTGVRFIKRTPDDMPIALRQGEADAGILYDPAATLAESQGWGRIIESAFWERHLQSPLVVGAYAYNRVMAEREPALANALIDAVQRAIRDARADPSAAKRAIAEYLDVTEATIDRLPTARVELSQEVDPAVIADTLGLYVRHGVITESPDLTPLLYGRPSRPQ